MREPLGMARPPFETDEKQRSLVKSLAMLGLQQEQICQVVGIRSPKTLRKHFRSELTRGELHAMANVMQTAAILSFLAVEHARPYLGLGCERSFA